MYLLTAERTNDGWMLAKWERNGKTAVVDCFPPSFPLQPFEKGEEGGGLRLSPIVVSISSSGFSSSSSSSSFPSAGSTSSHTSLSSLRQRKEPPLGREEEEATSDLSSPLPSPRDKSPLSPACVRVCSFLPLRDNSFLGKKHGSGCFVSAGPPFLFCLFHSPSRVFVPPSTCEVRSYNTTQRICGSLRSWLILGERAGTIEEGCCSIRTTGKGWLG